MIEYKDTSGKRGTSRIGKIRLGKKAVSAKGKEYPEKLDYFRVDPEDETLLPVLRKILGEKPKKLRIMFVTADREAIFPQWLKKYGKSGILCRGTGGVDADGNPKPAIFRVLDPETGETTEEFPCDPDTCEDFRTKRCKRLASLSAFILCDFPGLRTWQIDTTSEISIKNLNSRLDDLANLAESVGRSTIAGIPLVLTIKPAQVKARDKEGKPLKGKQTVFVMDLDIDTERLMAGGPVLAFLGTLASRGQIAAPPLAETTAPDGLYPRSEVLGADVVGERRELAAGKEETAEVIDEESGDPTPPSGAGETAGGVAADAPSVGLPDDVVFGCRALGLTKKQVKALVARYAGEDGVLTVKAKDELVSYLSGLVDLKESGDTASLQANIAALDLPSEDPNPAPAKAKSETVKKSAAALGLKGLDV